MGQFTTLKAADGFTLSAYVAQPAGKPRAGVLQDIQAAIDHAAQARAARWASSASHGFNCDQRGSYNEAAAQLARQRSLAFLASRLS